MKIKKLHIQNYKSLVDLEIIEPNPFTVFAGPNGAGKSNIFEALSFWNNYNKRDKSDKYSSLSEVVELFGGLNSIRPIGKKNNDRFLIKILDDQAKGLQDSLDFTLLDKSTTEPAIVGMRALFSSEDDTKKISNEYFAQFTTSFSRIFINNPKIRTYNTFGSLRLNEDATNLENVLARIFENIEQKEEIIEWIKLFTGIENIIIDSSSLSGNKEIFFKEKAIETLLKKAMISDGTYNILCLLTAVYQSDKPQFLCIEEPENGLNPYVIKTLVEFFRKQCEEKGHYIWLNTHSQTLVKNLKPEELILVDKVDGATQIKQFSKDYNLHGLELDEAWLSNALGGGVPW